MNHPGSGYGFGCVMKHPVHYLLAFSLTERKFSDRPTQERSVAKRRHALIRNCLEISPNSKDSRKFVSPRGGEKTVRNLAFCCCCRLSWFFLSLSSGSSSRFLTVQMRLRLTPTLASSSGWINCKLERTKGTAEIREEIYKDFSSIASWVKTATPGDFFSKLEKLHKSNRLLLCHISPDWLP